MNLFYWIKLRSIFTFGGRAVCVQIIGPTGGYKTHVSDKMKNKDTIANYKAVMAMWVDKNLKISY